MNAFFSKISFSHANNMSVSYTRCMSLPTDFRGDSKKAETGYNQEINRKSLLYSYIDDMNILVDHIKLKSSPEICTVSGGQDSSALILILLHFSYKHESNLQIIYFHHFWQEFNFLALWQILRIAFIFKLPYTIILAERVLKSESSASKWRQETLHRLAFLMNAKTVYTGHTLTDKLETALFHLCRGTAPAGLFQESYQVKFFIENLSFVFLKVQNMRQPIRNIFDKFCKKRPVSNSLVIETQKLVGPSPASSCKQHEINLSFEGNKICTDWSSQFFVFQESDIFTLQPSKTIVEVKQYLSKNTQIMFFLQKNDLNSLGNNISVPHLMPHSPRLSHFCASISSEAPDLDTKNIHEYSLELIRPLRLLPRVAITQKIYQIVGPALIDPTNKHLEIVRNRIRYQVFPVLRYFMNKNFDKNFNSFLESNQIQQKFLDTFLIESLKLSDTDLITRFTQLPIYSQRDLIKSFYLIYSGRTLSYQQILIFEKFLRRKIIT